MRRISVRRKLTASTLTAGLLISACTGGGSSGKHVTNPQPPDVVGTSLQQAVDALGQAGYRVGELRAFVDTAPVDQVLSQSADPGPPARITLTLSAGPQPQTTTLTVGTCELVYPLPTKAPCIGGPRPIPIYDHAQGPLVVRVPMAYPRCRANQLVGGHLHALVGQGAINRITLRNRGGHGCTLSGYPAAITAVTSNEPHRLALQREPLRFTRSIQPANLLGTNVAMLYLLTGSTTGREAHPCPQSGWHRFDRIAIRLAGGGVVQAPIPMTLFCTWRATVTPFAIPLPSR